MKSILLTGLTGFIGSHFAYHLKDYPVKIYALIRGDSQEEILNRALSSIQRACESYNHEFSPIFWLERLVVIRADVSKPLCCISDQNLRLLSSANIGEAWHMAASLNFEESKKSYIEQQNVAGINHLIDLAEAVKVSMILHVSTAYTVGSRGGLVSESLHPLDGPFNNCYEESKCKAEHQVANLCSEKMIDFRIFRPSVVVGPISTFSTGGSTSGIYGFINVVQSASLMLNQWKQGINLIGDPNAILNLIPIDELLEDLLRIRNDGFRRGPIYHLTSNKSPRVQASISTLCDLLDIPSMSVVNRDNREITRLEKLLRKKMKFYDPYIKNTKIFVKSAYPSDTGLDQESIASCLQGGIHFATEAK
jgi:nucleoside-diphosphate-sugar epimerase